VSAGFGATADYSSPLLRGSIGTSALGHIFTAMGAAKGSYLVVYCLLGLCACICWLLPNTQQFMQGFQPVLGKEYPPARGWFDWRWQPGWQSSSLIAVLLSMGLLSLSFVSEFIYFQF
jgi:hypothetical protein